MPPSGYVRCLPKHRTGDFCPNDMGEKLMPVITGVRQVFFDMCHRSPRWATEHEQADGGMDATDHADLAEAQAHFEALELELRGPDGSVVPTESIDVRDNEVTLAWLPDEQDYPVLPDPLFAEAAEDRQLLADLEHDAALLEEGFGPDWDDNSNDRPWEEQPEFPRYQIHVGLFDDAAIP